jgi:hypothetical protein
MKDAMRRHKWTAAPGGLLGIGVVLVALTLIPVKPARAVNANDNEWLACRSTVCETAAGPVNVLRSQTARLTVHNISDKDAIVVMSFIDGLTGEVLASSGPKVLGPHQGAFFDFQPDDTNLPAVQQDTNLPAVQLIGGVRLSRMRGTRGVTFGATLQVIEEERTSLFIQLQTPGPLQGANWNAAVSSTWGSR